MRNKLFAFVLVVILFAVVGFAVAQGTPTPEGQPVADVTVVPVAPPVEVTVEPPATTALPPDTETPADISGIVLAALFAGSATIGGSVFVTAVVGVLKMIVPQTVASGDMLKNVVSVVTWIAYSLAIHFGLGSQFQGLATFLAPILVSAAPLVGVLIGSSKLYLAASSANVPVWGYQRPAAAVDIPYVKS